MSDAVSATRLTSPQALEQEYLASLLKPDLQGARALIDQALVSGLPADQAYLQSKASSYP